MQPFLRATILDAKARMVSAVRRGPETEAPSQAIAMECAPAPTAVAALKADILAKRDDGFIRAKRAAVSDRYRQVVLNTVLWINGGKRTSADAAL